MLVVNSMSDVKIIKPIVIKNVMLDDETSSVYLLPTDYVLRIGRLMHDDLERRILKEHGLLPNE